MPSPTEPANSGLGLTRDGAGISRPMAAVRVPTHALCSILQTKIIIIISDQFLFMTPDMVHGMLPFSLYIVYCDVSDIPKNKVLFDKRNIALKSSCAFKTLSEL